MSDWNLAFEDTIPFKNYPSDRYWIGRNHDFPFEAKCNA